uniref:Uncharacterized protein n=1 Tax=Chenopodium quinoa TaxID=63459 RepID=A0A803LV17_CHEQI
MGCGTSKAEDLPLVSFCRERKDLIKSASNHRFALAAAHIAYFRQLKDVEKDDIGSSFDHRHSNSGHLDIDDDDEDEEDEDEHEHDLKREKMKKKGGERKRVESPQPGISYIPDSEIPSVIYEEPKQNPVYAYSEYNGQSSYSNYSNFGFSTNSESRGSSVPQQPQPQPRRPPTPPSPKVSAWDYFNPFETVEGGGYLGYFGQNPGYGLGSNSSSPDSREVREREGIPELEEETESEVSKEPYYYDKKKVQEEFSFPKSKNKTVQFEDGKGKSRKSSGNFGEGTSKGARARVPLQHPQREEPQPEEAVEVEKEAEIVEVRDVKGRSSISSPETETSISTSIEDVSVKKRGVSFDVGGSGNGGGGGPSSLDIESSKPSSSTMLSTNGTRDLREVVREIKDEFVAATDYGKEVSVLLEVGKEPYKSRSSFLKVILARVCSTSLSSSYSPSSLPGGYPGNADEDFDSHSLASALEKLYMWEKKLYKEVKDEERLRVLYEKQCKKLKTLDDQGAEISKIEATQASIRKMLTRLNVSVRAVDYVSRRIHKLRDEELQPRMKELIYGYEILFFDVYFVPIHAVCENCD